MKHDGDDKLREALIRSSAGRPGGDDCPTDDAIWAAAHGELPPEEAQRLVDHALECAACRVSFSMASGIEAERQRAAEPKTKTVRFPRRAWIPLGVAAAAMLILAVVLPRWQQQLPPVDEFRGEESSGIRSLVEVDDPLPRDAFVLRWTPGPPGTLYTLSVTSEDLTLLHSAEEIEVTELTVPAEALAALPGGSSVIWRIRATLPDARRVDSPVFRATLR